MSERGRILKQVKEILHDITPQLIRVMALEEPIKALTDKDCLWLLKKIKISDEFNALPEDLKSRADLDDLISDKTPEDEDDDDLPF